MHALVLAAAVAGFGEGSYRVALVTARQSGAHPGPLVGTELPFARDALAVELAAHGFVQESKFGTLIGGELLHRAGLRGREPGYVSTDRPARFFTRTEVALDLSPIRWTTGRLTFGGGAGADVDTGRWFPAWGRLYPIVVGRGHLFFSPIGAHLAYHWIPNTTNASTLTEHRFELSLSYARLHLGARYAWTRVVEPDRAYTFSDRELFAGYAF